MPFDSWMTALFWLIAIVASALYGWNAVAIFLPPLGTGGQERVRAWWWHQRWLNFLGAFVGWVAFWLLARKFGTCVTGECVADIGALDVSGALVAFVGVTGYLPNTVVSLVSGVGGLAGKLAELLAAWVARR